jgi:hypothetical protein
MRCRARHDTRVISSLASATQSNLPTLLSVIDSFFVTSLLLCYDDLRRADWYLHWLTDRMSLILNTIWCNIKRYQSVVIVNYWLDELRSRNRLLVLEKLEIVLSSWSCSKKMQRKLRECHRVISIDILYTLDSASNYSAIQKLKPWYCRLRIFPWNEKTSMFSIS